MKGFFLVLFIFPVKISDDDQKREKDGEKHAKTNCDFIFPRIPYDTDRLALISKAKIKSYIRLVFDRKIYFYNS